MSRTRVPKFRVPFAVVGGSVAVVEQDSAREIEQCIHAVLSTPVGSRIEAPSFGRPRRLFRQLSTNPTAEPYLTAVERDEPRARVVGEERAEEMVEQIAVSREAASV